jgi:hypothetical protein
MYPLPKLVPARTLFNLLRLRCLNTTQNSLHIARNNNFHHTIFPVSHFAMCALHTFESKKIHPLLKPPRLHAASAAGEF